MRTMLSRTALASLLVTAAACGSDQTGPNPVPGDPGSLIVASVSVSPGDQIVMVGASTTLQATAKTADGRTVTGRTVTWSVDSAAVATVSAGGVVTALSQGTATISATVDGKKGTARVQVATPVPTVASVELDVVALSLAEGASRRLVATPRDVFGAPIAGLGITWESSGPEIAMVQADGSVSAIRPGTVWVTARVHGQTATASVQVTGQHTADLLFSRQSQVGVLGELMRIDLRDSTRTAVPLIAGGIQGYQPTPSPDGSKVAYVVIDPWGAYDVRVLDLATRMVSWVTSGPESDDSPTWSPDGAQLAFRRRTTGPTHVWVVGVDGRSARDLNAGESGTFDSPAWSPLSGGVSRIAYARALGGVGTLWTMAPDGSDKRQVTNNPAYYDLEPAWSPDGQSLAFSRVGAVSRDIWIVNAAGGSERALVTLPMHQYGPAWSPDGALVAFTSNHEGGNDIYTVRTLGPALLARRTADGLNKAGLRWAPRP